MGISSGIKTDQKETILQRFCYRQAHQRMGGLSPLEGVWCEQKRKCSGMGTLTNHVSPPPHSQTHIARKKFWFAVFHHIHSNKNPPCKPHQKSQTPVLDIPPEIWWIFPWVFPPPFIQWVFGGPGNHHITHLSGCMGGLAYPGMM